MKIKLDLSRASIIESLNQEKPAFVPIGVLVVSGVLFIVFILPNILAFPSKKHARDTEVAKLNEIKAARDILNSINQEQLDSEVQIVSNALPSEKNFELILGAINEAATRSNALISGYRFADNASSISTPGQKFPSLLFDIDIAGNIDQAADFANELYKTYPVSSIKSISYSNGISVLSVEFYYKPFVSLSEEQGGVVRRKNSKELSTMSEISQWNQVSTDLQFSQLEVSSDSAQIIDEEEIDPTPGP